MKKATNIASTEPRVAGRRSTASCDRNACSGKSLTGNVTARQRAAGKRIYPEKFKNVVRDFIPRCRTELGYGNMQLDVEYMDGPKAYSEFAAFSIHVDHDYLRATISAYPVAVNEWKREGDDWVREAIAHEMSHIATQPMRDLINRPYKTEEEIRIAWEALTTILGRYVYEGAKRK